MESLATRSEATLPENTLELQGKQVPSPGVLALLTSAALSAENEVKVQSDSSLETSRLYIHSTLHNSPAAAKLFYLMSNLSNIISLSSLIQLLTIMTSFIRAV
jgi:hypothetical protein